MITAVVHQLRYLPSVSVFHRTNPEHTATWLCLTPRMQVFPFTFSHSTSIAETFHFQLCFQKANKGLMNTSKQSLIVHLHKCFWLVFLWPIRPHFIKKPEEKWTVFHDSFSTLGPHLLPHLQNIHRRWKKAQKPALCKAGVYQKTIFQLRRSRLRQTPSAMQTAGSPLFYTHWKNVPLRVSHKLHLWTTYERSLQVVKVLMLHYLWWLKCIRAALSNRIYTKPLDGKNAGWGEEVVYKTSYSNKAARLSQETS